MGPPRDDSPQGNESGDGPGHGSEPPDYRVYRARRRVLRPSERGPIQLPRLPGRPRIGLPGAPQGRSWLRWLIRAALAWVALSIVVFVVSTLIQQSKFDSAAADALSGGPNLLTKSQTVLVIGSDRREQGTHEPGANPEGPARADTLLVLRAGGGAWRRLSIPRDSFVEIPGRGSQKINAAYAFGGPALQIQTVEQFLGIKIDHAVEVDFAGFKDFIDALGGVKVKTGCVVSKINGGFRNGGFTLRLRPGDHTLDGKQALALARTRKNECNPREDDRTRARRQQIILSAIKSRLISPARAPVNFLRGPWIAWSAPKAIVTDMGPLTMSQLFLASVIGPNDATRVLKPSGPGPAGSLVISAQERERQVDRLLGRNR